MRDNGAMMARLARPEDATSIARIYNQGILEGIATFETEQRTSEQIASLLQARGEAHPTVVVERGGDVIAWAGVSSYRSRQCYRGVAEFSVYTDGAARRCGAGRAAVAELIHVCVKRGFWKFVSRIFPENAASRGLCRSLGFREVGVYRRHGRLAGQWRDVIIVERLIGEAASDED